MPTTSATLILNQRKIAQKIRRMAYQIYEANVSEKELVIAGISKSGYVLAERINEVLSEISDLKCTLCEVKINKKNPLDKIEVSLQEEDYKNKSVVLIDDVLNSGSTLIYGVKYFLTVPLKQLNTAVLVDRSHKRFPVKADFKGISLSTSLNETVQVYFGKKDKVVLR